MGGNDTVRRTIETYLNIMSETDFNLKIDEQLLAQLNSSEYMKPSKTRRQTYIAS